MADRIGSVPPQLSKAELNETVREADSFADDAVAASIKAKMDADRRVREGRTQDRSKASLDQAKHKLGGLSTFQRTYQNDQDRKAKLMRESGNVFNGGLQKKVSKDGRIRSGESIEDIELRIEEIWNEIGGIFFEIEAGGMDTLMKEIESDPDLMRAYQQGVEHLMAMGRWQGQTAARLNKMMQLLRRLQQMEAQARQILQEVLTGGTGLQLLGDPRLTFKKMFDRLTQWPRRVRPGYRPETDEEFDLFIGWVFEPPAYDDDEISAVEAVELLG